MTGSGLGWGRAGDDGFGNEDRPGGIFEPGVQRVIHLLYLE